ncbi:hypothetical protein TcasGA2_TC034062 [Tribolium castaneum]|uniref:Uncharacterized protein n=1 Tax=Tribolium castaneum TaxID=7070 RepID=A0A139WCY5_TRICA|nr:hypothetical protein TcasGA2_TC034062 [Tribolium castaneum]
MNRKTFVTIIIALVFLASSEAARPFYAPFPDDLASEYSEFSQMKNPVKKRPDFNLNPWPGLTPDKNPGPAGVLQELPFVS